MSSKTEIANMAISHLGVGKEIANIETEDTQEAKACRRFFDVARDATLGDFNWPFAENEQVLSLVETAPNTEWAYSYRYPSDCITVTRLLSGNRKERSKDRYVYKIGKDATGSLIYGDITPITIQYIERVTDTSLFPADFTLALSFRLAFYIAARLTKGDPYKLRGDMMAAYFAEIGSAKKNAINEMQPDAKPDSEFIQVRN